MSVKHRKAGEWVWLAPNSGFVGESHRRKAEIQPEDDNDSCMICDDPACREWATLLTAPDLENNGKRYMLCHVSEHEMFEEPQTRGAA